MHKWPKGRESVEFSATNGTSGSYFTPSRLRDNRRRADRKPVRARGGGPARECLLDMTGPCTDDRIAAVVDGQDLDKIKPISMPEQRGRSAQFSTPSWRDIDYLWLLGEEESIVRV